MNLRESLHIAPAVAIALREGRPVVALESAVLSLGLPGAQSLALMQAAEAHVRAEGAVPATLAVLDGVMCIGLSAVQQEQLCRNKQTVRASRRDLPILVATNGTGAATVSCAMILATLAGIPVLSAGCIGGAGANMDISADLQELRQSLVAVVCSGVAPTADIGLTLEYLETMGVPVLGLRTADFPAFYGDASGFVVDFTCRDEAEAARIVKTKWNLGLKGSALLCSPVPENVALDSSQVKEAARQALARAQQQGLRSGQLTPYLLDCMARATQGATTQRYEELVCANAAAAARMAVAYAKL